MSPDKQRVNYWGLSSEALAGYCHEIAGSESPGLSPALHAEADLLSRSWREGIDLPHKEFAEDPRRASLLASLRKRTIELLVRIDSQSDAAPPSA